MPKREQNQKKLSEFHKRFASVPTFNPAVAHKTTADEIFGKWCRLVYNELAKDSTLSFNDRIKFYSALRSSSDDFSKFGQNTWARKHPVLTIDAIEGIDYTLQAGKGELFAAGLSKMLPAAFKGGHNSPPSVRSVTTAAEFLCAALDKMPSALLGAIKRSEGNFDALSTDHYRRKQVPLYLREYLYCLITFLQVEKNALSVKHLVDVAAGHRTSEPTDQDSAGKAKPVGKKAASRASRPPKFGVSSDVFFAYVQSLYAWNYEPWQTPERKIRHNFHWSADDLKTYIQRLQESLNAESEMQSDGDVESQTGSEDDDDQTNARRLALEFIAGLSPKKMGNPGMSHARMLKSLYEGYFEYCAEHAAVVSGEGAYLHAKLRKLTATQQSRILNAHPDFIQQAFATRNDVFDELVNFLSQRLQTREKHSSSLSAPVRFLIATTRAGIAQGTGRVIAALLGLYAFANIGNADIIGPVVGLFVAEVFLCVSSAAYLGNRHAHTTAPNNHRRITKLIFWATLSASLCEPVIAAACQALNGELESEIERLSNDTLGNATQADLTRLDFLTGVQNVGGPAAWLIGRLLAGSLAKIIRQVMQTVTVSQYSAGLSVTYLDNTPLTDDDRETINAVRDLLYIGSTTGFLVATPIIPIWYPVWSTLFLSMANEAVDEINPDLAIYIAKWFRDWRSLYAGSNAAFKIERGNTPRLSSFAQFKSHFLPQAASRKSVSGLSDLLSEIGDIYMLLNQEERAKDCKIASIVCAGILGARRGAMATYMAGGGSGNPSGLPSLLMRVFFGVRDAVGRIQERPAVKADLVSLNYENNRFKEPRLVWPWKAGRHLIVDGASLANVFPPDEYRTFHQCEAQHVKVAALNMLIMHWCDDYALLLSRSDRALHNLALPALCEHVNTRQHARELDPPLASALLPEFACVDWTDMRSQSGQPQIFDDAPAVCAVYKDAANKERAVFIRRVSAVELDDYDLTEADYLDGERAKSNVEAHESSAFRIYSPLMHCEQMDTEATTMGKAISNFLETVQAQSSQPVTIAYNVIRVDLTPDTIVDIDALVAEFLKHPPRLPTHPALVSPSDVQQAKPLKLQPITSMSAKRLDTVTKADRFSGALNTLINDFVSGLSDEKARTILANVDKIRKSDRNRPKWSEIPDLLQSTGAEFVHAKATYTRGAGVAFNASGGPISDQKIDALSAIAISYASGESERRVAIFREAQEKFVARDLRSGDLVELDDLLLPDVMSDAIGCLLTSAGVDACAVLFITPRKRGTSSHTESSSSDEGSKTPRVSKEETPRLPALPGDIESTQPQTGIDSPSAKIPLPVQVSLVVSSDCFSGAINTLINDFLLRHIDVEAKRNALRKIIGQKRGNSRPKWSEVPKTLAMDDVKFVYAKASIKNKQLSIKDASGDIDRSSINALHVLAVSYKGKNDSDVREAIYIEKGGFLASSFEDGKPVQMSDPSKKAGSMWEVLAFFMDSKKLSECSLLFIVPPPHSSRRASPSSDAYSESPSGRSKAEIESGDATANKNLVEVELPYKLTDAWKANGLAFERVVNASDPLAGAVKTLCLHYLRGEATMELVVNLLGKTSSELPKDKGCDWRVLATTNLARQLPFKFATVERQKLELKYNPNLRKSVCELQVLAVRIDNHGAVGGDYVIFKCSDTQYIAVHTGTAERYAFELDAQVALANMDSALLHFLKNEVRMTSCSILFIGG